MKLRTVLATTCTIILLGSQICMANTSVKTLYRSPQNIIAHVDETNSYIEPIEEDGYIRIKLTASNNVPFELHVTQEEIDSDYGNLYTKDDWRQTKDGYVWEGHTPVVEGTATVSVQMFGTTAYGIRLQWSEFEEGNGYKLDSSTVKLLKGEMSSLSILRDVGDGKYSGKVTVASSSPKIVKIIKDKKKVSFKALKEGSSTITVILDNDQILKCKVDVVPNIYRCSKANSKEVNDTWNCEAFVRKAKFTKSGNLLLTMQLNSYWPSSGFGWKGQVVGLTDNNEVFVNASVSESFYVPYGSTKFKVKIPKKELRKYGVNLYKAHFTSIGKVVAF